MDRYFSGKSTSYMITLHYIYREREKELYYIYRYVCVRIKLYDVSCNINNLLGGATL